MRADLFALIDPPPDAIPRLRATLQRRARRRRRRRVAVGIGLVLVAALATLRAIPHRDRAARPEIAAFDPALHPALVGDSAIPPLSPRGETGMLVRRETRDDAIVLYELGP